MSLRFKSEADFANWDRRRRGLSPEIEPRVIGRRHHSTPPSPAAGALLLLVLMVIGAPFVVLFWGGALAIIDIWWHALVGP